MSSNSTRRTPPRAWRSFSARDGRDIESQRRSGPCPCCPSCGEALEAQPNSRITRGLPLGARAHDLCCRSCRRFWAVVQHTERSLRLLRMRRLAAAIRAVQPDSENTRTERVLAPSPAAA